MKYIFHEGEIKGEYPVESFHVVWYDGTDFMDNRSFDEDFIIPENFDYSDLSYVETEEEQYCYGDHSRVFVHMKDGSIYELELRKLTQEEFAECTDYYGGRRKHKYLSISEQSEKICKKIQEEIEYLESLPPEKAKRYARNSLMRVGLIDENGDWTEPYKALAEVDDSDGDKKIIRAVKVRPLDNYLLLIKFENDEERLFNCYSLLEDELFEEIRDIEYFKTVHIDEMGLVCWDEATDINPYLLYDSSIAISNLKI